MHPKRLLLVLAFCSLWGFAAPGPTASVDQGDGQALRSVDLDNVKIQWFSSDQEDLPAWVNARFELGPFGGVQGRVIETDLSADGTDEDGDPNGFETKVFDTADGSLRAVELGTDACDFSTVYPDKDAGRAVYRLRRAGSPGAWTLSVAQKGKNGVYAGHNRFPLSGRFEHGDLRIAPAPDAGDDDGADQL